MKILNIVLSVIIGIGLSVILNYPISLVPNNPNQIDAYICGLVIIFHQFFAVAIGIRFFNWFDSNIKK